MNYRVFIQDPSSREARAFVDELTRVLTAQPVTEIRAHFACASGAGLMILFAHQKVRDVFKTCAGQLVIGNDQLTDREALERLRLVQSENPNLKVLLLCTPSGSLFQSGFFLAKYQQGGGALLTGNTRLTPEGLFGGLQAFSVLEYSPGDLVDLSEVAKWEQRWSPFISPIDSSVMYRADQNLVRLRRLRGALGPGEILVDGLPVRVQHEDDTGLHEPVLVTQITKGGDRWQQLHLVEAIAVEFFGSTPRTEKYVAWRHSGVNAYENGGRRKIQFKPANSNYRIETDAHDNEPYPNPPNRPVLVVRREGDDRYRYLLLLPGQPGYTEMNRLCEVDNLQIRAGQVARTITSRAALLDAWPECPL